MSFPISCCCCAFPEAVYVSSPLQTCCIKTLVLGAVALIYRGCCFITVTLATVTQEETVFAHNSLGQKLFLSGFFPISQNLFWLGPWLFPPLFLRCFIFPFTHLHTSLHKSVAHALQMLSLWKVLAIKVFNVSVTRHHKWVTCGCYHLTWQQQTLQERSKYHSLERLWGLVQIWTFKEQG